MRGQFQHNERHRRQWFESVGGDGWFFRAADHRDAVLIKGCGDAFIHCGRVYVRGKELREKLDRGLKLPAEKIDS